MDIYFGPNEPTRPVNCTIWVTNSSNGSSFDLAEFSGCFTPQDDFSLQINNPWDSYKALDDLQMQIEEMRQLEHQLGLMAIELHRRRILEGADDE